MPMVKFIRYEFGRQRAEITHTPGANHHWWVACYRKIDKPAPAYVKVATRECDTLREAQAAARSWCRG